MNLPSTIAIVGLGYVGLPLATAFGKVLPTIGFDIQTARVLEIRDGIDRNGELSPEDLDVPGLEVTDVPARLRVSTFIIVSVPTPIDTANRPNLGPLIEASKLVGQNLKGRDKTNTPIVVYESTVYPGVTEEFCIPELEKASGMKAGKDFKVGYSPERINPGDTKHTLENIIKVVAGQDAETTEVMAAVYGMVVKAGTHRAPDIRTAEAAKVIENIQRDLNIALMNELAVLFHQMNINTRSVLEAARTKWNFLPFEPGLVAGHCIPVDPYYLTHKAQEIGYHPEVILAGRRINDSMSKFIARETVKLLIQAERPVKGADVLVLGAAVKENVRDARNARVIEMVRELEDHGISVSVNDPLLTKSHFQRMGLNSVEEVFNGTARFDAIILAVPHRTFLEQPLKSYVNIYKKDLNVKPLVDVKGALPAAACIPELVYWSL